MSVSGCSYDHFSGISNTNRNFSASVTDTSEACPVDINHRNEVCLTDINITGEECLTGLLMSANNKPKMATNFTDAVVIDKACMLRLCH